jgi:DNA polymerase-4
VHADLDAFYASVEQRDDPSLAGRPVVVGGAPEQRGVVAAASYEARRFGVRSAMSMRTALRLCPVAVRVPPRFGVYAHVSTQVMALFRAVTDLVEPVALDEAFLDVSDSVHSDAGALGQALKQRVRETVGLTLSVGVATNKAVAKVASDLGKPDGLTIVPPGTEAAFLAPLPVGRLWGVGPRSQERLERLGIVNVGQLAGVDPRLLTQLFGRMGEQLSALARGVDLRNVSAHREVKSVGRETTFNEDTRNPAVLRETLHSLCAAVAERLQSRGLRGRTLTLKVRRDDFSTRTRRATPGPLMSEAAELYVLAERLLSAEVGAGERLRLIGVSVSGFAEFAQLALFSLSSYAEA